MVKQIFGIIKKINAENNTTIFLVEQNANLALHVAHKGYVMENGRITLSASSFITSPYSRVLSAKI
ncbi:MAG: hypothetical protein R6W88_17395 [Desulfobacterales bacterium]